MNVVKYLPICVKHVIIGEGCEKLHKDATTFKTAQMSTFIETIVIKRDSAFPATSVGKKEKKKRWIRWIYHFEYK